MCDEMQIKVVYWYLVDDGKDSAELLKKFLPKYRDALTCTVIKNEGRGSEFSAVDKIIAELSQTDGSDIKHAVLPALHAPTMHKIDTFNFSFWGAANFSYNFV